MATITVTPKLGPYGSGPLWVGVEVRIDFDDGEKNDKKQWDATADYLNKGFKVKADVKNKKLDFA